MEISVAICTHNPKLPILHEVLDALKHQSLSKEFWNLLIVDNASEQPIKDLIDISWHPSSQIVRENSLGLTHARLRAIAETQGAIMVFVDDDNILDLSYLENVLTLSKQYPIIGAWGGSLVPRFEVNPPDWFKEYAYLLAIKQVEQDRWSNIADWNLGACPAGAGLCLRRAVAQHYADLCNSDPMRKKLDRIGLSVMGCGDLDMAFTACDLGMGTGIFTCLSLIHVIPETRLSKAYLLRVEEGNATSIILLRALRSRSNASSQMPNYPRFARVKREIRKILGIQGEHAKISKEFFAARERGTKAGMEILNAS